MFHVPGARHYIAALPNILPPRSLHSAGTPIVLKEQRAQLAKAVPTARERRRLPDAECSRESKASFRLSCLMKLRLTATAVRGARPQLLTRAYIHRIVPPQCRSEFLSEGRARVGVRDRFSLGTGVQPLNWCTVDALWFSCV